MEHKLAKVALVGRPNVGKSTLFNRLVGKRQAVVADVAGTTRDRIEQIVEWDGKRFMLIDMAGVETSFSNDSEIGPASQAQVKRALEEADLIVWVLDGTTGPVPADENVYGTLRKLGLPIVTVINKCDHPKHDAAEYDFARFGLDLVSISALNGRGTTDLLDLLMTLLPHTAPARDLDDRELRISIVGRPNVGKSTLLNKLSGEERAVVSSTAGTTRDAIDTVLPADKLFGNTFTPWETVRIMDTAGLRRPGKLGQGVENWSAVRTFQAVEDAEVALLLLDATEGMVHQDLQIADRIVEKGRAMVLLINKWDVILEEKGLLPGTPEEEEERDRILSEMLTQAPFLRWVQVAFISAKEGLNLSYVGQIVLNAYTAWNISIDEDELSAVGEEMARHPRLKNMQGIKLIHSRPPVFHAYVEGRQLPHFSTIRSIENTLRDHFPLGSTPIKVWIVPSLPKKKRPK